MREQPEERFRKSAFSPTITPDYIRRNGGAIFDSAITPPSKNTALEEDPFLPMAPPSKNTALEEDPFLPMAASHPSG